MKMRMTAQREWAELETQRRLSLAVADRLDQQAQRLNDAYDSGRRLGRMVEEQKSDAARNGMLLIFPMVASVALVSTTGPAGLLVGAVCGVGIWLSLRRHGQLCKRSDQVEKQTEQALYLRSTALLEASNLRDRAERLGKAVGEAMGRLQEYDQLDLLRDPGSGGSVSENRAGVIVGGVRVRRANGNSSVEQQAASQGWIEWNDERHLGQEPFREAGEVTYLYPGGVATGSIQFDSPFLSRFRVRTREGEEVEGNSNTLGTEGNRLWISDPATLQRLAEQRQARQDLDAWLEANDKPIPLPPQPPLPDFSRQDELAARRGWTAYSPADHGPDRPPFVSGARVAYARPGSDGAIEVVEGSATFHGRWAADFEVRSDDGRVISGNTNQLSAARARLWLV